MGDRITNPSTREGLPLPGGRAGELCGEKVDPCQPLRHSCVLDSSLLPRPDPLQAMGSQEGLWDAACSRFCPLAIFMASDVMVAARLPAVFLPFFPESEFPFPISLSRFKGKY